MPLVAPMKIPTRFGNVVVRKVFEVRMEVWRTILAEVGHVMRLV